MTPGEFTTLEVERRGDVLRVTIAHPTSAVNAVDAALHHDLTLHEARNQQAREGCAQRRLRHRDGARAGHLPERGPPGSAGGAAREAPACVQRSLSDRERSRLP